MTTPEGKRGVRLTMLNSMAGPDVGESFARQASWGIELLDLKDCLFGKAVEDLDATDAEKIRRIADDNKLRVHTLSSSLFAGDVGMGESAFRGLYAPALDRLIAAARILNPSQIRLLAAATSLRSGIGDSAEYLALNHPWVYEIYREAVDMIAEAGFRVVIENEVGPCIFSNPVEITGFFRRLDRDGKVFLTWDIQNLWQVGVFPSLETYRMLKPIMAMVHVKGGKAEIAGGKLKWRSGLREASWPVIPIVSQAVADGSSPVICLNPSHGETPLEGYHPDYKADLEFLRGSIPGII